MNVWQVERKVSFVLEMLKVVFCDACLLSVIVAGVHCCFFINAANAVFNDDDDDAVFNNDHKHNGL
jgi:hypothetical protein